MLKIKEAICVTVFVGGGLNYKYDRKAIFGIITVKLAAGFNIMNMKSGISILLICLMSLKGEQVSCSTLDMEYLKFNKVPENNVLEIAALKNEMVFLQDRVAQLEKYVDSSGTGVLIEDRTGGTKYTNHILKKRAAVRRRRIQRREVAFQASLTKESATFKLYDTIIFNNVITNIGHAYNKHTGIFTAPVSGTYTFNTNIVSEKGHYVEASIQVNDIVTVSAISDHRISPDGEYFTTWEQGNAVAILRLNRGDKVSVSVQWPQGSHVIHGVGKSSFSGCLLRSHERR